MDLNFHILAILLSGALLGGAGWWAWRAGRSPDWDRESRAVFTEEEPEGMVLDRFPAPSARGKTFDA
ncbi:MAG: hypothetical protein ABSH19_04185 [Opitutales bacterium]|jgi:hypothetical protein